MLLEIRRNDALPCFRQICDQVAGLIDDGSLRVGERLPPSRLLAGQLGLNRSTVVRAYQELWALGYVESRPGSYSTVRERLRPRAASAPTPGTFSWPDALPSEVRRAVADLDTLPRASTSSPGVISFAGLAADRSLCPLGDFGRCVRKVLAEGGAELLDYGDPAGHMGLREAISRRMRTHGVHVTPAEILLTGGAQHGLELALRLLARPGDSVVVESPTYSMVLPLLRLLGLEAVPVPMRPDGLDLDALQALLDRTRPSLVYTIPNFHNPTGVTTSQAHRERLLALAEAHGVPIIEDGFEEEMKYFGRAVLPIKSMDRQGLVIYLGTFSKVAFPGLRIGWIAAAPDAVRGCLALLRFGHLSGSTLGQAAVARFCEDGSYEAYLRRIHTVYRRRMLTLQRSLKETMPEGVTWTQPQGGYTLLLTLPGAAASEESHVLAALEQAGVRAAPGSLFFAMPPDHVHLRLSISSLDENAIVEGCRRLGRGLRAAIGRVTCCSR
jgi:DNA-binding transcriptional MocR family regulator